MATATEDMGAEREAELRRRYLIRFEEDTLRAADLFAAGLVTTPLMALPVLMTTTAHVAAAVQLAPRPVRARQPRPALYAILAASTGLAPAAYLAKIPVVGMLVAASMAGGFGTPIGLVLLIRLARDPQVMGPRRISRPLAIAGWAVTVIVGGLGLLVILGAAVGTS